MADNGSCCLPHPQDIKTVPEPADLYGYGLTEPITANDHRGGEYVNLSEAES